MRASRTSGRADLTDGLSDPDLVANFDVPARPPQSGASSFERQLYRITLARAQIDRYNRTLLAVPVRKPIIGEVDMSSPFGMRMDPFVKGPAIHRDPECNWPYPDLMAGMRECVPGVSALQMPRHRRS